MPTSGLRLSHAMAFAVVFAWPSSASPASNTDARQVVVVDLSEDTRENARVTHDVVRALHKHPDYAVRDLHAALNAGDEVDAQNDIKTAQAFHRAGQDALARGDVDDAVEQLESASRLMEKSIAVLGDPAEFRTLLLNLGMAHLQNRDRRAAKRVFQRAVAFRARDDDAALTPAAARALGEARTRDSLLPRGAVAIESDPPHAEIWVDGRYKGVTPTTAAGLTEGSHVVAIQKVGYARRTVMVRASAEGLLSEDVTLGKARRKPLYDQMVDRLREEILRIGPTRPTGGDGVRELGSLFLADVGVIVQTGGSGAQKQVTLHLFDAKTRRLLNRVSEQVDWSRRNKEAIAALVGRLVDIDYATALGGAPTPQGPGAGSDGVTGRWWFWTAVGAGVLGAATLAAVLLGDEDPAAPPTTGSLVITF